MAGKKKAKAAQASEQQAGGQEKQTARDGRPVPPLLTPKRFVPVTTLIPQQLFVIHGFLYQPEAQSIIRGLEQMGLQPTPPPPKAQAAEYAVRRMQRTQFESQEYAEALWSGSGLAELLAGLDLGVEAELVGLNSNIRGYRYDVGDRFGRHFDGSCAVGSGVGGDCGGGELSTEYTLLVYLGDSELEGGETVFWLPGPDEGGPSAKKRKARAPTSKQQNKSRGGGPVDDDHLDVPVDGMEELAVRPTPGTLLLHRHGEACLLHEGRRVTRGRKYVLRSDLVFRSRLP